MFGAVPTLLEQLNDIETREKDLVPRRHRLEHLQTKELELPESIGELRQRMEDKFQRLAIDSGLAILSSRDGISARRVKSGPDPRRWVCRSAALRGRCDGRPAKFGHDQLDGPLGLIRLADDAWAFDRQDVIELAVADGGEARQPGVLS